jgi:hypothetical protein
VTSTATCPVGTIILGGGFTLSGGLLALAVTAIDNHPSSTTTWTATATNYATAGVSFSVQAYAVCSA